MMLTRQLAYKEHFACISDSQLKVCKSRAFGNTAQFKENGKAMEGGFVLIPLGE